MKISKLLLTLTLLAAQSAWAAPVNYIIDSSHTYPSFEADHMGLSMWRGKFNKTTGTVSYDKAGQTGSLEVTIDANSVDFGHEQMNAKAKSAELFDTAKFPQAIYKGKIDGFAGGAPTRVVGDLTLRGVTRPVNLTINSFKCMPHFMLKREVCGADAVATFKRVEFGMDMGKAWGFNMDVTLRIQVEAIAAE